jgi:hypothetical protein
MTYQVRLIDANTKERLQAKYEAELPYSRKSEIYGCCIKLLTASDDVRRKWDDNFYAMSENVRSHGRLYLVADPKAKEEVCYDPLTKTAFVFNMTYYGWIKSVALAVAGDVLEDEHRIYSVHGAAIDVGGTGVSLIAPPKTGKTTHAWGLLRLPQARLVTDDWYFVRLSEKGHLAFASEKNCYVEGDIGKIWKEYAPLVAQARLDNEQRAILNVRRIVGTTGVVAMTTLRHILLLKRDPADPTIVVSMTKQQALKYLEQNDFCNPHQLVRDERKLKLRRHFFIELLAGTKVHMVNTVLPPEETQQAIRDIILARQR